jgi:hypothetical protein
MTTATKSKRATKLDRSLEQGEWIAIPMGTSNGPCRFVMPTDELQAELENELHKNIKKHLKESGYELLHATRREHPFHSDILRERIDELASLLGERYDPTLEDEAEREAYANVIREGEASLGIAPCEIRLAVHMDGVLRENRRAWAKGFAKYREYLRDPNWWHGTYVDRAIYPADGQPLPDGPPPKPVFYKKGSEVVLALHDGIIDFWARLTI